MNATLSPYYNAINKGNPQHCRIYLTTLNGATKTLTEDDIKVGGFRYDARSTSGETLELGSAIAAQLTLTLNAQDWMSSFHWLGAKALVQVGIESESSVVYGNIGEFVIDEANCRYDVWTITALDNLVKLDKLLTAANWNTVNNGTQTAISLIRTACAACGVRIGSLTHTDIVNTTDVLPAVTPDNSTTWRNIVQWAAEITCSVAYCNENGELCLGWYDGSTTESAANEIDLNRRYKSNTAYDDVVITGLTVTVQTNDGDVTYSYGTAGYQLAIEANPFITTGNVGTLAPRINGKINGFYYMPFDAQTVPYFYFQPLDACYPTYLESGIAAVAQSVITHITYTLNGATTLEAVGKSAQSKSYQNSSAFTRAQAVIIDNVKQEVSKYASDQAKAVEQLNTLMANAMGLQKYVDADGKWYAYYAPKNQGIENASIVYTLTSEGLAWAYGWNDGNPDWQYGITADGSAILRQIFVEGIKVSNANTPFSTEITPTGWSLNSKGNALMSASVSTGEGILTLGRVVVDNDGGYIKIGKARLYGTDNGMDIVIED